MLSAIAAVIVFGVPPLPQPGPFPALKAGDTWEGETRYLFSAPEAPKETELYVWREDWKFLGSNEGVASFDRGRVLIENRIDGQLIPVPEGLSPVRWVERWTDTGVTREPALEEASDFRIWRLGLVVVGKAPWEWPATQKWPAARASSEPSKGPGASSGRPVSILEVAFREPSGISARGKATCDLPTGWCTAGVITATGVPRPGGDGSPANLKFEWKTTKLEAKAGSSPHGR